MSVFCVLEQRRDGTIERDRTIQTDRLIQISLEALSAASELARLLATDVEAVVIGSNVEALAEEVSSYGVSRVLKIDHELLAQYTPDGYTAALEQVIRQRQPKIMVFPHTYQVRDYAPKLSTRLGRALVSDVVDIKESDGRILFVRQLFQGKLNAEVSAPGDLDFVSIQAGSFRAMDPAQQKAPVEAIAVELDASKLRSKPEEPFREAQRSVDLGAAQIIVSVGRGIKDKENLPMIEELAQVMRAELAASRPICDNGWLPMERQVGSSGQTVSPKVYLAVGISGAIQHLVGMKGSQTVVAINKDENAPIFETADYAVVGDLFEIVPALIDEIKKVKT